jgi:hypothetical protein
MDVYPNLIQSLADPSEDFRFYAIRPDLLPEGGH